MSTSSIPPVSRREQKRAAILDAAAAVFLAQGYVGASMDEVAQQAAVSKQTVYQHFGDKRSLFIELVEQRVRRASDGVQEKIAAARPKTDAHAQLVGIARVVLDRLFDPTVLRLRRLVIGEAARFPEIGRTFQEIGPGRTIALLREELETLVAAGAIDVADTAAAAEALNWLITAAPLNRAMLSGVDEPLSRGERDRYAHEAVRVFLVAYAGQARSQL